MPANDLPFTLFRQPRSLTGSVGFTSRRKACVSRNAVLRWWLVLAVSMCLRKLEVCCELQFPSTGVNYSWVGKNWMELA